MHRFDLVEVEATVTRCYGRGLVDVHLSNGHRAVGHLDGALFAEGSNTNKGGVTTCLPGDKVLLEFRTFDLSSGRVVRIQPSGNKGDSLSKVLELV